MSTSRKVCLQMFIFLSHCCISIWFKKCTLLIFGFIGHGSKTALRSPPSGPRGHSGHCSTASRFTRFTTDVPSEIIPRTSRSLARWSKPEWHERPHFRSDLTGSGDGGSAGSKPRGKLKMNPNTGWPAIRGKWRRTAEGNGRAWRIADAYPRPEYSYNGRLER